MKAKYEEILVSPDTSIKEALKLIDEKGLRIALVVSDERKLLGVVTDGDVRRGILKSLSLDDEVSLIMEKDPIIGSLKDSKEDLHQRMLQKQILAIPIVENEVIIGIETLTSVTNKESLENPVFLMAGGFGTRLRPLTNNCPKPMLKVGTRPILETTIIGLRNDGFKNFYISTHYLPEMIKDHFGDGTKLGVSIKYVHEESPLGTGGALSLLPPSIEKLPIIVLNGDILTKMNFKSLIDFHNSNNAKSTICVREYEYQVPYGVIRSDGRKITSMVEKPIERFHVNAGMYVLDPSIVSTLKEDEVIDMPSLLEREIMSGQDVLMYPVHEYWLDIGQLNDFKRAQEDIKRFWNE